MLCLDPHSWIYYLDVAHTACSSLLLLGAGICTNINTL